MKKARQGSILYHRWTKDSTYYLGIFTCYNREIKSIIKSKTTISFVLQLVLLACLPLSFIEEDKNSKILYIYKLFENYLIF